MARILYIGDASPGTTSLHRMDALRALGHAVDIFCPYQFLPRSYALYFFHYRTGFRFLRKSMSKRLVDFVRTKCYDIAWINSGELTSPKDVVFLKKRGMFVLSYNNDDPFGYRDFGKWRNYLDCVRHVDLSVVVREVNISEAYAHGARSVFRVFMSCDESAHALNGAMISDRWKSEVAFVGTWMPERGPFIADLIQQGLPISIWGGRWERAKEWAIIRPHWRGNDAVGGGYAQAIVGAKISLGLLSKGNRDLHTTRTAEVPYLGGLLLCEDTTEHRLIFRSVDPIIFFNSPASAFSSASELLSNPTRRQSIVKEQRASIIQFGMTNRNVVASILERASALGASI